MCLAFAAGLAFAGACLAGLTSSDYYSSDSLGTFLTGFFWTFLGFSSSEDSSYDYYFFAAFLATGFWTGDFTFSTGFWIGDLTFATTFFTGFSSSYSDYSDDSCFAGFLATFWAGDTAFRGGDTALVTAFWVGFAGLTLGVGASYDYYSSSEGFLAFFFSTVGKILATGDLTLARVFLGFSSSDSYSSEDSLAFFFWTICFWTGDLTFSTFFGFSSSLSYYSEDSGLTAFLAGWAAFFTGPLSVLICLWGFFSTTGASSSSSSDSCLGACLAIFFC